MNSESSRHLSKHSQIDPKFSAVQERIVGEDSHMQRLDNYLVKVLKGVPKGHIYKLIRTGQVRINKKRAKAETKLSEGDIVRLPPIRGIQSRDGNVSKKFDLAWLSERILYEDKHFIIFDKPSGLSVHKGSGVAVGVIDIFRANTEHKTDYFELVHRLDRDTSGCLLIAKKRQVLKDLQHQLLEQKINKTYQALLVGHLKETTRTVKLPLEKKQLSGERVVVVSEKGKAAHTQFNVIERFSGSLQKILSTEKHPKHSTNASYTLVSVKIMTGRTHQIRVHANAIGHPIAGDQKYGDSQANNQLKQHGLKRLFLHAAELSFIHPVTHKKINIKCPLAKELMECLTQQNLS